MNPRYRLTHSIDKPPWPLHSQELKVNSSSALRYVSFYHAVTVRMVSIYSADCLVWRHRSRHCRERATIFFPGSKSSRKTSRITNPIRSSTAGRAIQRTPISSLYGKGIRAQRRSRREFPSYGTKCAIPSHMFAVFLVTDKVRR